MVAKKQRILITGYSGFIGNKLVKFLSAYNYQLYGLSRTEDKNRLFKKIKVVNFHGDFNIVNFLRNIDIVIHLIGLAHKDKYRLSYKDYYHTNVEILEKIASQSVKAGVKRFIYLSSASVNAAFTYLNFPIQEDDYAHNNNFYSLTKMKAEKKLIKISKQSKMTFTIIRPPLVYDLNAKSNFGILYNAINLNIPLPFLGINNKRSYISINNLNDFIITCLLNKKSENNVFLTSDDELISTTDLVIKLALAKNKKIYLFKLPKFIMYFFFMMIGKNNLYYRVYYFLNLDISKAKKLLSWSPKYKIKDFLN